MKKGIIKLKCVILIYIFFINCSNSFSQFTVLGGVTNQTSPGPIYVHNVADGPVFIWKGNTPGAENTGIGTSTLSQTVNGGVANWGNTAVGFWAIKSGGFIKGNTAVGSYAITNATTTDANTAVGYNSMAYFNTASGNTASGYYALLGVRTGTSPNFSYTSTGTENCAFGRNSISSITSGNSNSGFGSYALSGVSSGSYNIGIGANSQVVDGTQSSQLSIQNVIYGRNMTNISGTITGNVSIGIVPTVIPATSNYAKLLLAGNSSSEPSLQLKGVPRTNSFPFTTIDNFQNNFLYADVNGVIRQSPLPTNLVTAPTICNGFVPIFRNGVLDCSIITEAVLPNCGGAGTHTSVNIGGGTPLGWAFSGPTCYNVLLNVNGAAYANTQFINSDKRYKTNIQKIESALDKINKIRGVSYYYDTKKFPDNNFSEAKTLGFIAQELNEVLPEVVSYTDKGFYAVNYDALIPVLTQGIKEQQTQIEKLTLENEEFKLQLTELTYKLNQLTPGDVKMKVNSIEVVPNPITGISVVSYKLDNANAASFLIISDLQGKLLKQISLAKTQQQGQVQVSKKDLPNGMYVFTIVSGNAEVQSKKVLVSE
ncbi:MAG: tail fiber domain-containing protein [Bacteroidota bacterium]